MYIKIASTQMEYASLFRLRTQVFVVEQNVDPLIELDEKDTYATHFVVYIDNKIIATCRAFDENGWHLGRIAVLKQYRGKGIGKQLLMYVQSIAKKQGILRLELGAQLQAVKFYENCGFVAYGDIFEEANIQHRMMEKYL